MFQKRISQLTPPSGAGGAAGGAVAVIGVGGGGVITAAGCAGHSQTIEQQRLPR